VAVIRGGRSLTGPAVVGMSGRSARYASATPFRVPPFVRHRAYRFRAQESFLRNPSLAPVATRWMMPLTPPKLAHAWIVAIFTRVGV